MNGCFGPSDLGIVVQVPKVQATHAVHCSKDGWMYRRPHDIVHIVCIVFKGIEGLVMLQQKRKETQMS